MSDNLKNAMATFTEAQRSAYQAARISRDPRFDGTFFVAVKTTGIFCRPVCPARLPAEQNIEYYSSAVHASAQGYRPCLRCRPDSAPGSYAWLGVGTTVGRALRLLSAIPPQPIANIAQRLGISERYLHQLTTCHLGASPKRYQLFNQLLFAKQLLQQSALSVDSVASACGFESARRLQDVMRKQWRLTPRQLRTADEKQESQTSLSVRVTLNYRPPYKWSWVRDFLERRKISGVETLGADTYQRNFMVDGKPGHVVAIHKPAKHGFEIIIKTHHALAVRSIIENLGRVLDIHADPLAISDALEQAGLAYEKQLAGIRLPGAWSAFEAGCRAILGQQVSLTAATIKLNQLVKELGPQDMFGKMFPSPQQVARSDLQFLKMPGRRRQALRSFAVAFSETADGVPDETALLSISGIGPWTVNYYRMRGQGEPDIFLQDDLVIKKMAQENQYQPDAAAPWRSYLTLQLWQLAEQDAKEITTDV